MKRIAFLKRNISTAAEIEHILRLPDSAWDDLEVTFGHDGLARARVSFMLSRAQLHALIDVLDESGVPDEVNEEGS